MSSTCCSRHESTVTRARAEMVTAARRAANIGDRYPKHIDTANQRKADYIRAREARDDHAAEHVRTGATA